MTVTLSKTHEDLLRLPVGASYTASREGAKVSVKMLRDTIIIEAECDSLVKQVEYLEEEVTRLQGYEMKVSEEELKTSCGFSLKWYFYGILTGIALLIIILIVIKLKIF
jgi:acid phosphatase family membrane protein YuiD